MNLLILETLQFLIVNKYKRRSDLLFPSTCRINLATTEAEQTFDLPINQMVRTRRGKKKNLLTVQGMVSLSVKLSGASTILCSATTNTVKVVAVSKGSKKVYQIKPIGYVVVAIRENAHVTN